jgi:hypothetical protein
MIGDDLKVGGGPVNPDDADIARVERARNADRHLLILDMYAKNRRR